MTGTPVIAGCVISTCLFFSATTANALSLNITALFKPDPSKPQQNAFINTTPNSGYCQEYPGQCASSMFSIRLPLTFDSNRPIQANHGDPRQGAMFKVPTRWRMTELTHTGTGETAFIEVRWAGLGSRHELPGSVVDLVGGGVSVARAHEMLWSGLSWAYAPAPCRDSGVGGSTSASFQFFWRTPAEGTCAKRASFLVPSLRYSHVDFAYEMRTPNPLRMSSGQYTGSIVYAVGPGRDVDVGDVMVPSDSLIILNFKLDVEHTLKVDLPPGGDRVELVPQGGWQAWLNGGQKPTQLFRDLRFHISTSSRFKMRLECQHVSGNTCAIAAADSGHAVPVNLSVTLPDGLTDAAGQSINRRRLWRDGSGTELVLPGFYIDRRLGGLHFEVAQGSVEQMLDSGATAYTGNVTVIWDSEV